MQAYYIVFIYSALTLYSYKCVLLILLTYLILRCIWGCLSSVLSVCRLALVISAPAVC